MAFNTQDNDFETDITCTVCNAEFVDGEDLKIHLQQMHKISDSQAFLKACPFCDSFFADNEKICYHIRDEHLSVLRRCKFCLKIFTDSKKQREHEKKHKKNMNDCLACSQCYQVFHSAKELQDHEEESHDNNLDGVVFKDLHPLLSSILNMNFTNFIKSIGLDTPFTCIQCKFSSYDMDVYIKHLQTQNCCSLTCDSCGTVYKSRKSLCYHFGSKNQCNKTEKIVMCVECKKKVKRSHYKDHKKVCQAIKCLVCKLSFDSMSQLSEHQSIEHPLNVEIKHCKLCSRECVGTIALRKHIERTHKDDFHLYKYMCKECKEVFKHPQKLFAHYFMRHKDLEPYTCKICDKKFRIRKKFTLHIKLDHNSIGFVEFDENYHVYFTENKSEKPFIPTSLINDKSFGVDLPGITSLINKNKEEDKAKPMAKQKSLKEHIKDVNEGFTTEIPTETEGNMTEEESKGLKRKKVNNLPSKRVKKDDVIVLESSDDNEPLQTLKNKQPKKYKNDKARFTCKICNKYCYTYQNYHNHMSLHSKNEKNTCVKCSREFKTCEKLEIHMKTEHSSSKLTEYLKNLLEQRKKNNKCEDELTLSEKFQKTVKKVKIDHFSSSAVIKVVDKEQSVKNFIESFTPDDKNVIINNTVTVKAIQTPFYRRPVIKMKKFEPEPEYVTTKLAMPVKCARDNVKVDVTVKLVTAPVRSNFFITPEYNIYEEQEEYKDDYARDDSMDSVGDREEAIPEVADEVLIENEDPPKITGTPAPHKIIIENLPEDCKDISIAHLLPEAPYFKIVKVNQILKNEKEKEEVKEEPKDDIELPNGLKIVTVNPLAHLLGDKPVEEVLKPMYNKYYKPKVRNFQHLLKKAFLNLDKRQNRPKKRSTKEKSKK